MSAVDLVFIGQSNCIPQTDTRSGSSALLQQADVPAWSVVHLTAAGDVRMKVVPGWAGLDSRYLSFAYSGSRQWCGAPESCVRRLRDTYAHSPRLFRYACGSSTFADDWPTSKKLTQLCGDQIVASRASSKYPGAPSRTIIVTLHGESDGLGTLAVSLAYAANYQTVLAAVRSALGDATTHVIHCQLSTSCGVTYLANIRAAQAAWVAGDAYATLLDMSPFTLGVDALHYTQSGAAAAGGAIADIVAGLLP